jgi:hypothetical protein
MNRNGKRKVMKAGKNVQKLLSTSGLEELGDFVVAGLNDL